MSVYSTLGVRKGDRKLPGGNVFRKNLTTGLEIQAVIQEVRVDETLAPPGKAKKTADHIRSKAIPQLITAERQRDYIVKKNAIDERNLRTRVAGKSDELDGERRAVMRAASPTDRLRLMRDPMMRAAMLRGGAILSGVTDEQYEREFEAAIEQLAPPETLAARADAKEAVEFLDASIAALRGEIERAPVVAMSDGSIRTFHPGELASAIRSVEMPPALSELDRATAEIAA
jgi:hypothetical protein